MRDIRFRAWDKVLKRMIGATVMDSFTIRNDGAYSTPNDIAIMQYTGLDDKNGKPIFEGDLINIFGGICEIEFYEGSFGYWIWKEDKFRNFITATISDKDEIEVIGNIYEDAHLLDKQT